MSAHLPLPADLSDPSRLDSQGNAPDKVFMYNVIIIGLGAMGSAAAYELAEAGARVLGLEQFSPLHHRGSSHGKSRMIRKAYFEGDFYIPMLERSFAKWRALGEKGDKPLLHLTGGLYCGLPEGEVIASTLASAKKYNLEVEVLSPDEVTERFPAFRLGPGQVGVFEAEAGNVNPDETLDLYHRLARKAGAELNFDERVEDIQVVAAGLHIRTSAADYKAKKLIITAGPWLGALAAKLGAPLPLEVWRMALHWFKPAGGLENFTPPKFIPNLWHMAGGEIFYGFPWVKDDIGVKYAFHNRQNPVVDPENPDRAITTAEIDEVKAVLATHVPGLGGNHVKSGTCLYTPTPDGHFVVGMLPGQKNIMVAGGFSGHGFKFTPVIGEILKDLALEGKTRFDISGFDLARFG